MSTWRGRCPSSRCRALRTPLAASFALEQDRTGGSDGSGGGGSGNGSDATVLPSIIDPRRQQQKEAAAREREAALERLEARKGKSLSIKRSTKGKNKGVLSSAA